MKTISLLFIQNYSDSTEQVVRGGSRTRQLQLLDSVGEVLMLCLKDIEKVCHVPSLHMVDPVLRSTGSLILSVVWIQRSYVAKDILKILLIDRRFARTEF